MKKYYSGILLPIFSIPSIYGIGSFGKKTYEFIDFLSEVGVHFYQVLPLGETTYGNSPYSSLSNYAGSMLYIDLEILSEGGYLTKEEVASAIHDTKTVDYDWLNNNRKKLLHLAYKRFDKNVLKEFAENKEWVKTYALYMVLREKNKDKPWNEWKEKDYSKLDIDALIEKYEEKVYFYYFIQYVFFNQWARLKEYANKKNIKIIGDVPIYSSFDSADVWANVKAYKINEKLEMEVVSGCPPDGFSDVGQVWNTPIYNYDVLKKDGYSYLVSKIRHNLEMFDLIRLDHFRGYESYYEIKAGEKDGLNGKWQKGPDMELFSILNSEFGADKFIAEDLGYLTKEVEDCLLASTYPGMRVLEFGFDGNPSNKYLTSNYPYNSVAYSGTHDNAPLLGWLGDKKTYEYVSKYYCINKKKRIVDAMLNDLLSSEAKLVIIQLQDYMCLGKSARINVPGTVGKNWEYRLNSGYNKKSLKEYISCKIKRTQRN